jgi:Ca2+-binding EF-hand superfamily protein
MTRVLILALLMPLMISACSGGREYKPSPLHMRTQDQFKRADTNGDEKLTREELAAGFPEFADNFDEIDTDHNGFVNLAELQSYFEWSELVSHTDRDRKATPHRQQPH